MTSVPAIETAKEAAKRLARPILAEGYEPEALHTYTDASGQPIYYRIRASHPERGDKWIRPMYRNGRGFELGEPHFDGRKPLYCLHELTNATEGATVFIVEGEKPADALRKLGLLVTTSGSADSARKADWSPLKRLRPIIWRDNDGAGESYQTEVLSELIALGISARIIDVFALGLPQKGDAVEWLSAHPHATPADVLALAPSEPVRAVAAPVATEIRRTSERAPEGTTTGRIAYRRVSDVQAKPIHWLWPGRIARGKVSILAGHPGLGKSQITASLAAIVSTGGSWPVDRTRCERGSVVFLSAEDNAEDTIRPRLEAAGADLSRVFILDAVVEGYRADGGEAVRAFNLKTDLARLANLLEKLGDVVLIVIDPITAYLGDVDSNRNAEIRALLAPLAEMAAKAGAAVVCVSHLNKNGGSEALMRVTGSLGFVAAARAAFVVAKDQDDGNRRLFLPMKNNIGNDQTGLAFVVRSAQVPSPAGLIETSHVVWDAETVTVTADEAIAPQVDAEERSAVEDAKAFLTDLLAEGPMAARRVYAEAREAGHSERTVRRAQKALGVEAIKEGMGAGWTWRSPTKVAMAAEDGHTRCLDTFGKDGPLREPLGGTGSVTVDI